MVKPTDEEIDTAVDIIERLIAHIKKTEPYAVRSIKILEEAVIELSEAK